MKKAFYTLGILALASFTFASCQKELKPENEQEGKLVTVTFVAESANTKSGVLEEGTTSVSYKWTAEDVSNMKLFTVSGNTLTQVNNPTVSKVSDTKLTITASVAANSTVRAILAKTMDENNNPIVPSIQNPGVDSFDPNADILVSEDEEVKEGMPEEGLIFKRQVTINKMTLHNLGAGEKVSSVTITSDQDLTGAGGSLTLNYTDATVPENGQFPVYFVAQPNADQNLTVTVVTDQNNYSKTLSAPVSFALGTFTKFNVGLQVASPKFVKVISNDDLTSGSYLIVYETGNVAFNGALTTLDAASNTIPVSIETDVIEATNATEAAVFNIDKTTGTIQSASGFYIGVTSYSNGLKQNTSASAYGSHSISINDSGNAIISLSSESWAGSMYLNYNSNSGDTRFRYYKNGSQKPIQLYKRIGPAPHITTWTLTGIEITTHPTKTTYEVGESFSPSGMVVTASYVDADDASNTKTEVIPNADLVISPSGALTISDENVSISYGGFTVTQPITVEDHFVTLDWTYPTSGAATSAGINGIEGVKTNGLGSDYNNDHTPYCIKFDGDGDYIQVKTDAAIGEVSVSYKMIGGASTSTLNIKESADGTNWTNVEDLTIAGAQNSTGTLTTTNLFDAASRYVQIYFNKGSNVGIGGITITKTNSTPRFTVNSPLDVTVAGGTFPVSVSRKYFDGAIAVTVPDGCDWITATNVAAGENSFSVTVATNSGAARSATLTLNGTGVEPQNLVVNQVGSEPGTEANPYTVAQAIEVANALGNNATTPNEVYITGTVSTVDTYYANYKSITYYISSDGNASNQLEVYSGKGLNGADFSDITDLAVGDQVIIKGQLKKFYNSSSESTILEVNTSSQIISITKTARYTVDLLTVTNGTINASATSVGAHGIVTLTATPATGYEFDSWNVKDASNNPITVTDNKFTMPASDVTVSATFKTKTTTDVTDVLNRALTGITGTSYSDWSGKQSSSTAVYAGNSAGGNSSIQLRSDKNNSGIVSTSSGGKLVKVAVTWDSHTTTGRTIQVYGKKTAYESASDLYDTSTRGTLLGTIVCGTSTELSISGDYTFIGIRSSSGALYITEIDITWTN